MFHADEICKSQCWLSRGCTLMRHLLLILIWQYRSNCCDDTHTMESVQTVQCSYSVIDILRNMLNKSVTVYSFNFSPLMYSSTYSQIFELLSTKSKIHGYIESQSKIVSICTPSSIWRGAVIALGLTACIIACSIEAMGISLFLERNIFFKK